MLIYTSVQTLTSIVCIIHTCVCLCMHVYVDGYGDWSTEGCSRVDYIESDAQVTCHCTHLSSFTILLVSVIYMAASKFAIYIY